MVVKHTALLPHTALQIRFQTTFPLHMGKVLHSSSMTSQSLMNLQKLSTVKTIAKKRLEVLRTPVPQARNKIHWTDSNCRFNHITKHREGASFEDQD